MLALSLDTAANRKKTGPQAKACAAVARAGAVLFFQRGGIAARANVFPFGAPTLGGRGAGGSGSGQMLSATACSSASI
eukprot:423751-Pyramimonas_sp.AAC.1